MFVTKLLLLILLSLNLSASSASHSSQDTVTVSLYYESLCPFCRDFVKNQLYPGYLRIKEALSVDLTPYGNANQSKINGKWKFTCQHGRKECFGNKMQACVLGQNISHEQKIDFVGCIMSSSNPASSTIGQNCASIHNINWTEIVDCLRSDLGNRLLAQMGDKTNLLVPKLTYVPHFLFNGVFNKTLEDLARDDFLNTVCSLFKTRPRNCDANGTGNDL